jgi:hypothetical protein
MDFAHGVPIEDLRDPSTPQWLRDVVGDRLQRLVFREMFEFRLVQTDPNFANYLIERDTHRIVLLDFGATRAYDAAFIARYAALCRGMIAGDREDRVEAALDLIFLVCEPFRHPGRYDFAHSNLPSRAREAGFDLAFRKGFLRAPPPETVFLHRKLVGTFLLCARIGARVDVGAILEPLLERQGPPPC